VDDGRKRLVVLLLAALIVRLILLPSEGYKYDYRDHLNWFKALRGQSMLRIYERTYCNMPPLWTFIMGSTFKIYELFSRGLPPPWVFKVPAVCADLVSGVLFYYIIRFRNAKRPLFWTAAYLFNPALIYVSAVWGKWDSMLALTTLAMVYLLDKKNVKWAWFLFGISLSLKHFAVVLFPILAYKTLLIACRGDIIKCIREKNTKAFKPLLEGIGYSAAAVILTALPFLASNSLVFLWREIVTSSLDLFTVASMYGFNLWMIVTLGRGRGVEDSTTFLFLSYKSIGMILFGVCMLLALYLVWRKKSLYLVFAFTYFSMFFFLTRMHDRYIYQIFGLLLVEAVRSRKMQIFYVFLSATFLLNLLWVTPFGGSDGLVHSVNIFRFDIPGIGEIDAEHGSIVTISLLNLIGLATMTYWLTFRDFTNEVKIKAAKKRESVKKIEKGGKVVDPKLSNQVKVMFLLLIILAAFVRIYRLDTRIAHHDEGVFGWEILKIIREGKYNYNSELHGPFLFHLTSVVFKIFGASDFTLRITQAIFGAGAALLCYRLKKWVGVAGMFTSAAFIAFSPALVYYSRMSFHEAFFVFFFIALILSWFEYVDGRKKDYFYLTCFCLAMLFCIKEMSWISSAILGSYGVLWFLFSGFRKKVKRPYRIPKKDVNMVLTGLVIFILTITILYTSFFRNPGNLKTAIVEQLIFNAKKTTERTGHNKPWDYYPKFLLEYEPAIFITGILGALASIRRRGFQGFFSYYALASAVTYSVIPYKTAWNIVYTVFPLTITSGFLVQRLYDASKKTSQKTLVSALVLLACTSLLYVTVRTSFIDYQNNSKNKLAYVQTTKGMTDMLEMIEKVSIMESGGKNIDIKVTAKKYWPVPWYLRDFKRVGYWGRIPDNPDARIIIGGKEKDDEIRELLKYKYHRRGYSIWPGTNLILYIREDLWSRVLNATVKYEDVMYLSILEESYERQDWGVLGKDVSVDGNPLSLGGEMFYRGLGAHANSEIVYKLDSDYRFFEAVVGLDDESEGETPSVEFLVYVDGNLTYRSGVMTTSSKPDKINVSVADARELKLVVSDGGTGVEGNLIHGDHADWADAKLTR